MLPARVPTLIVHGGAGADSAEAAEYRAGVRAAVLAGWTVLAGGGTALDAVETAVRALEDDPRLNAGRRSRLPSAGPARRDAPPIGGDPLRVPPGPPRA